MADWSRRCKEKKPFTLGTCSRRLQFWKSARRIPVTQACGSGVAAWSNIACICGWIIARDVPIFGAGLTEAGNEARADEETIGFWPGEWVSKSKPSKIKTTNPM